MFQPIMLVGSKVKSVGEQAHAILHNKGLYHAAPLFVHDYTVYAKYMKGYIKMHMHTYTSLPKVTWISHNIPIIRVYASTTGIMQITRDADNATS